MKYSFVILFIVVVMFSAAAVMGEKRSRRRRGVEMAVNGRGKGVVARSSVDASLQIKIHINKRREIIIIFIMETFKRSTVRIPL